MHKITPVTQSDAILTKTTLDSPSLSLRHVRSEQTIPHCEAVFLPSFVVYHILQGQKRFFSGNAHWDLNAGDTILIRRLGAVSCEAPLEAGQHFEALSIHVHLEPLLAFAQEFGLPDTHGETCNACILEPQTTLNHYLQGVQSLIQDPANHWEPLLELKARELLMLLFFNPENPSVYQVCSEALSGRRRAYFDMLSHALEQPSSTEDMASAMHMSLSAFKREFKSLFAQTPARYLMERRLERAQQLLLTSQESVQHIAYQTGFENVSHFIQAFKRAHGETPGAYREAWPTYNTA